VTAIIQDIVSIFFVLGLGYFAGRRTMFSQAEAEAFNRLVLDFAFPAALFISIVNSSREELLSDVPMLAASVIVFIGWYFFAFLTALFVFRRSRNEAGIAGLSVGAPTVGFLGMAVLNSIFGGPAALSVAIASIVVNVLQIPLGGFFIAPPGSSPAGALLHALRQPVVIAPLVATALVAAGIHFPPIADAPLALIGHSTTGVAVFAAGVLLSVHRFRFSREVAWNGLAKMVLVPATMLGACLALGIGGDRLEELVLLSALPPAFISVMLAGKTNTYIGPASSSLIIGALSFAATAPAWMAISRYFAG